MTLKLIALAIAAAFAIPAQAGGDKAKDAKATSGQSASQGSSAAEGKSNTGNKGADAMFNSLDKNKDGFMTREEVKGTPHDKDFAKLDKNNDGKISPQEHAAAPEHQGDKAAAGGTATTEPKAQTKTEGKKY